MGLKGKIIFLTSIPILGLIVLLFSGWNGLQNARKNLGEVVYNQFQVLIEKNVLPLIKEDMLPLINTDIPKLQELQDSCLFYWEFRLCLYRLPHPTKKNSVLRPL